MNRRFFKEFFIDKIAKRVMRVFGIFSEASFQDRGPVKFIPFLLPLTKPELHIFGTFNEKL